MPVSSPGHYIRGRQGQPNPYTESQRKQFLQHGQRIDPFEQVHRRHGRQRDLRASPGVPALAQQMRN
ncbi:MAG: hypothetical protein AAFY57_19795, partial [Cyanobacteria bacterium J06642_2]